jgi:small subunit ribosomal protein S5
MTIMDKEDIKTDIGHIKSVSKTTKGGRLQSFGAMAFAGDGGGLVGFGTGKSKEVVDASRKAISDAKKNMIKVPLMEGRTLHHDVIGKHGATTVVLKSAPSGTGMIVGDTVKSILKLLGVKDVVGKLIGSNNPYNVVMATFNALKRLQTGSPKYISEKRNKKLSEVIKMKKSSFTNEDDSK